MDIRKIRKLIDLMVASDLQSLEVKEGEHSISLSRRNNEQPVVTTQHLAQAPVAVNTPEQTTSAEPTQAKKEDLPTETAPMVGMFYTAPDPNEPNFVKVGQKIEVGDTIGIIEAMKIMNPIPATKAGVIQEIIAKNAEVIEFGQPILVLKPE